MVATPLLRTASSEPGPAVTVGDIGITVLADGRGDDRFNLESNGVTEVDAVPVVAALAGGDIIKPFINGCCNVIDRPVDGSGNPLVDSAGNPLVGVFGGKPLALLRS